MTIPTLESSFLKMNGVTKRFGGLTAVDQVSLEVVRGSIVGLIGPNGAGKTTLFGCLTGALPLTAGRMFFKGEDISRKKPYEIARLGIARSSQIPQPFGEMTTLQNAMVGAFCKEKEYERAESLAADAVRLTSLWTRRGMTAKQLNLGERKKLEIAKALATQPEVLLLDEVMAGLTAAEVMEIVGIIRGINQSGVTILLIEHIMEAVMSLSDRIIVLNFGKKIMEGTPEEVGKSPEVIEAYFGVEEAYNAEVK